MVNNVTTFITNFSAETGFVIKAMMVACVLPWLFALFAKMAGGFRMSDNANPRQFLANATGLSSRLNAVQQNSFEGLPIFLSAVIVAMYYFVPQNLINLMAWLYVCLRIGYGLAYAFNAPLLRSVLWGLGMFCCLTLFYLAIVVGS